MNGIKLIKMYEKEIMLENTLRVAAGTTGFCGGDTGHGGQTFIELEDIACTDINCEVQRPGGHLLIKINLGGDAELATIIEAFEFIAKTLRRGSELEEKENS